MKKVKKPKVVIGNPAISPENISQALDFLNPKKRSSKSENKKYKFLDVVLGVYPGALVISWAVKSVGFGELSFYLSEGKIKMDSEGMSQEFVSAAIKEVLKKHKKKTLKINLGDKLLERAFERLLKEVSHNN